MLTNNNIKLKRTKQTRLISLCCCICGLFLIKAVVAQDNLKLLEPQSPNLSHLPENIQPVIGAWFWDEREFTAGGYKQFIDQVNEHACYDVLSVAVRRPGRDITEIDVHNQIRRAVDYAAEKGIRLVFDLDPRLARRKFEAMYPDELQQSLWLHEVLLNDSCPVETSVRSIDLTDHMNGSKIPYISLDGSLLRTYSYYKTSNGIDPNSLTDISQECKVTGISKDSLTVLLPVSQNDKQTHACVMVAFTHLTPDLFAPHLIPFTQDIIRDYADVPMAGGMRDEWGFPPSTPANRMCGGNHFWYSKYYALQYAEKTGGRELLSDCLLMYAGIAGKEKDRLKAINNYMELNRQRNKMLEADFYRTVKEVFGPEALILTHPTWYPYPNRFEFKKNGLFWWEAKRDWAQTDEVTPFAVRTALAKKWGSPVWYNQYYSIQRKDYETELWSSVLAGGRINYHPIYPGGKKEERHTELFRGGLMRGESRVRLLNFISKTPLNCPVAVVFGHPAALNWAGPCFEDVGMRLADTLWSMGIPTDLIPTSEIENGSLFVNNDGVIQYGAQHYSAVILYHPEFEKKSVSDFFRKASTGPTNLFRFGNWTRDFSGNNFDGNAALPEKMLAFDKAESIVPEILKTLKKQKFILQTPASRILNDFGYTSVAPPTQGFCRLIDGMVIQVAGTQNAAGDLIDSTIEVGRHRVSFKAVGLAAVRLDSEGNVEAIAAGGLTFFKSGDFVLKLDEETDLALWKNEDGQFEGVIQGVTAEVPPQLFAITKNWGLLKIPQEYGE